MTGSPVWAHLLHLSFNIGNDVGNENPAAYCPDIQVDDDLWTQLTQRMSEAGFTMAVIDVGDAIRYESHPEIAVNGAWSLARLGEELHRLRELGLEPIPKLNFSTAHDAWLGEYSRQVSTRVYYRVCSELIEELTDLFNQPRLFHLGMDEETFLHQATYPLAIVRQHDLWWHDLEFLANEVERGGSRAWIWSDYAWHHPDRFYARMPKRILQSNWYYRESFAGAKSDAPRVLEEREAHLAYLDLDEQGYDQLPTASNHETPGSFARTVEYCTKRLDRTRLLGFVQTSWRSIQSVNRDPLFAAIDVAADSIHAATTEQA